MIAMKCIHLCFVAMLAILVSCSSQERSEAGLLLKNANVIVGDGSGELKGADILVRGDSIVQVGKNIDDAGAKAVDMTGKTIMPALISAHVHIGVLKGNSSSADNYTRQNILDELKKYAEYGILNLQVMGTDRPLLFQNGLYDSIRNGLLPGARMLSAGYGFNIPQANIDPSSFLSAVYRPSSPESVPAEIDSLAALNIKTLKIWVDDAGGSAPKMKPEIYQAIIREAHQRGMQVAAHVYYLSDARRLVNDGIDIIAHGIRDSVVDAAFVESMKKNNVIYIPTLALDDFSFVYSRDPEWINDPFFKRSLEPGVYDMLTSEKFRNEQKNSPSLKRNTTAFTVGMQNVKKLADAGVVVTLGTDSGAFPIRTQGFSEHLELQLLRQAGLTPMQVIVAATQNAAKALKIDDRFGTLQQGKIADLLVLDGDPLEDIRNSRKIEAVYKAGEKVDIQ